MAHTCHAIGCQTAVPPKLFMCKRHWYMLPKAHRDAIWREYVPGQETRKDPTDEYLTVAQAARIALFNIENGTNFQLEKECRQHLSIIQGHRP